MKLAPATEELRANLTQYLSTTFAFNAPPAWVPPVRPFTEAAANQAHAQLRIAHADSCEQMIQRRQYIGTEFQTACQKSGRETDRMIPT